MILNALISRIYRWFSAIILHYICIYIYIKKFRFAWLPEGKGYASSTCFSRGVQPKTWKSSADFDTMTVKGPLLHHHIVMATETLEQLWTLVTATKNASVKGASIFPKYCLSYPAEKNKIQQTQKICLVVSTSLQKYLQKYHPKLLGGKTWNDTILVVLPSRLQTKDSAG